MGKSIKIMERLQGKKWHKKKYELILIRYQYNKNGHVKGYYADKNGNKYTHWLNNEEIDKLGRG